MYVLRKPDQIHQGDLLEGVESRFNTLTQDDVTLIDKLTITLPYAVIMSQDCDLEQDFQYRNSDDKPNQDKILQSILVCPAFLAEEVRAGQHLQSLGLKMQIWTKEQWGNIKSNQKERFHYLKESTEHKLEPLVIDFKRYYAIPPDVLYPSYEKLYKLSIDTLYREDLSLRFANYLSRIGLPDQMIPQPIDPVTSVVAAS